MLASTDGWSATLTIAGGALQIIGVVMAWRALRTTKELLNKRAAAARAARNPIVPPGPQRRARPNLPSDIPASLRPPEPTRDIGILEEQVRRLHDALAAAEQRAWRDTDSLEQFTAALVAPSRDAVWSCATIIAGVVLVTVGGLLGLV